MKNKYYILQSKRFVKITRLIFFIYLLLVIYSTLMPNTFSINFSTFNINVNIIPFYSMFKFIEVHNAAMGSGIIFSYGEEIKRFFAFSLSFWLNVMLFIPFGFLVPTITKHKTILKVVLLGVNIQ